MKFIFLLFGFLTTKGKSNEFMCVPYRTEYNSQSGQQYPVYIIARVNENGDNECITNGFRSEDGNYVNYGMGWGGFYCHEVIGYASEKSKGWNKMGGWSNCNKQLKDFEMKVKNGFAVSKNHHGLISCSKDTKLMKLKTTSSLVNAYVSQRWPHYQSKKTFLCGNTLDNYHLQCDPN